MQVLFGIFIVLFLIVYLPTVMLKTIFSNIAKFAWGHAGGIRAEQKPVDDRGPAAPAGNSSRRSAA